VRLEVRKTETIEGGHDADAVGNRVRVKVVKNKVAPPFRRAELEIMFGKGVSAIGSLLDAAVKYEIIDKKGAWYSYGEEKVAQGRDSAREYLENKPEFAREVDIKLRKLIFPGREFPIPVAKKAVAKASVPAANSAGEGAETVNAGDASGAATIPTAEAPASSLTGAPEPAAVRPVVDPSPSVPAQNEIPHRGPGRPPAPISPATQGETVHRGPGRPPRDAGAVPVPSVAVSEGEHRGPGRPRKAADTDNRGSPSDALF
jgi:recombination protein RecA